MRLIVPTHQVGKAPRRARRPRLPAPPPPAWAAALGALALLACATPAPRAPAGPPARPAPVAAAPRPPLPLPDEARACRRHADCDLAGEVRVVRARADCGRAPRGPTALNGAAAQRLAAAAVALCGPPRHPCACGDGRNVCCPPVARRAPSEHAACVRARCELRPGAAWTEDEQREDAAGRGTEEAGECYLASDCPAVTLTAFPAGVVDARGRERCPVCPRPGPPAADEAARIAALAERCPRRQCRPATVRCRARRCVREPDRPPRPAVVALPLPPEPALPPEVPSLPRGRDYRCASARDCALAPPAQCACGALEPVARGAVARRTRAAEERCRGMPCNVPRDPPPVVPVCYEGACASAVAVDEVRAARTERARLGPARAAWERQRARVRAAQAKHDEIEAGGEP